MVTGENEDVFRIEILNKGDVLVDGICRAGEPGPFFACRLIRGQNIDAAVVYVKIPGLAASDVAVELKRTILRQDADRVNAGVGAVGEGEIDDSVLPAKGNAGFCHILRKGVKARALPAGKEHGNACFAHGGFPPFWIC